jgi:DNA-binding NarL/FixJ family response regulator
MEASGVAGILLKGCSAGELRQGFSAIVAGETWRCEQVRAILETAAALRNLTARERQVLSLAARGRTNGEIAELLSISAKTADNHRTSIMRKLNVHTTSELVLFAVREGLLDVAQP